MFTQIVVCEKFDSDFVESCVVNNYARVARTKDTTNKINNNCFWFSLFESEKLCLKLRLFKRNV